MADIKFTYEKDEETNLYRIVAAKDLNLDGTILKVNKGDKGGLISRIDCLSHEGTCWIGYNATVINSTIKDSVLIDGTAKITNSTISDNVRVLDNAQVSDSIVEGNVQLMGDSKVSQNCYLRGNITLYENSSIIFNVNMKGENIVLRGNARIVGPNNIVIDNITLNTNAYTDNILQILLKYGNPNKDNLYTVYKLVKATNDSNIFRSYFDSGFFYELNKTVIVPLYNKKSTRLCDMGLHVSFSEDFDWNSDLAKHCDTMLTCHIDINDVLQYQHGKARVKKLKVIKARKYPLEKEAEILSLNHGLNSKYVINSVINNKTFEVCDSSKYKTILISSNNNNIKLYLDEDDSADNYNIITLGSKDNENQITIFPNSYKETIVGDNIKYDFNINHNLNSRNIMVVLYNLTTYRDCTRDCNITYTDENNLVLQFKRQLNTKDTIKVMVIKPNSATGVNNKRGASAVVDKTFINVFPGKNINKSTNSIDFIHKFNTLDIFGNVFDNETKESIDNFTIIRKGENMVTLEFSSQLYDNRYYVLFLTHV